MERRPEDVVVPRARIPGSLLPLFVDQSSGIFKISDQARLSLVGESCLLRHLGREAHLYEVAVHRGNGSSARDIPAYDADVAFALLVREHVPWVPLCVARGAK